MSERGFTTVADIKPPLPVQRVPASSVPSSAARLFNGFFEWFGSLGIFSWQVLRAAVTPPYEWRELIRQLDEVGTGTGAAPVGMLGHITGIELKGGGFGGGSIVKNHIEQRLMNADAAVVFNKSELTKAVHKEAYPGASRADHLRQRLL